MMRESWAQVCDLHECFLSIFSILFLYILYLKLMFSFNFALVCSDK